MKKSIYVRLIVHIIITILLRGVYLISAFLMGFGSASDHTKDDILLNAILFPLNCLAYWMILYALGLSDRRIELLTVSLITLAVWVTLSQFVYQKRPL
jgi:hypothetical protein